MKKAVAIMQPYLFPYLGYFHLIEASDVFVFYDDVNFMKKGWINRNRVLNQGREHLFTLPLSKVSQNSLICDISLKDFAQYRTDFLQRVAAFYRKAPYFEQGMSYLFNTLNRDHSTIAGLATASVCEVYRLLGREKKFLHSANSFHLSRGQGRVERLTTIIKELAGTRYVNAPGGRDLYQQADFSAQNIELKFIQSEFAAYPQYRAENFFPALSIIDVLMNNDLPAVEKMFSQFSLV